MRISRVALLGGLLLAAMFSTAVAADEMEPAAVAGHLDELLAQEQFGGDSAAEPAKQASDEVFLRRLALDLVGVPPTPEEITAFALDPSSDKRQRAVERLLADERFGQNWARYWRDVIMYRRSEDRALLTSEVLVDFLADKFNHEPHWDKIAHEFITATGDVREVGATAIMMAQMGNAEDTTAEMSRIFMGIQIQCAQCHDHPTDRWQREQFHELAAFFPRIAIRPVRVDGKRRSFEVVSIDKGPKNRRPSPRRGTLEHHMPDLEHPEEIGTLMQPVFFVTGEKLETGSSDAERRETVADWMTDRKNEWFSKAFVNRVWSEMVGRGFYEPVDDIGPDRQCSAPKTLDYLAERFADNKYDVKWLYETIASTEAYGRVSHSRIDDETAPFVAACPQRLRADQLYNALLAVLGIDEPAGSDRTAYRNRPGGPRGQVNQTFGYDPSVRRDEIMGSIPQALFLMNAPELARAIDGERNDTALGKLLAEVADDKAVVTELYLRSLAREPKQSELQTCLDHVRTSNDRADAFEDILWALVNSTEFLNRK